MNLLLYIVLSVAVAFALAFVVAVVTFTVTLGQLTVADWVISGIKRRWGSEQHSI